MTNLGYPTISSKSALELGELYREELGDLPPRRLNEIPGSREKYVKNKGGGFFDNDRLETLSSEFDLDRRGLAIEEQKLLFTRTARRIIDEFPIEVVQDLDFWRYLALFPFRNFVIVASKLSPSKYGGYGDVNIDRWTLIESLRWADRLALEGDPDDEYVDKLSVEHQNAGRSGKVRDMVISTVVRRKWSRTSAAARAFIDAAVVSEPIFDTGNSSEERQLTVGFNGRVARLANNVLFDVLDQDELTELFTEIR